MFTKPGVYQVVLKVSDNHGAVSTDTLKVKAGNTAPVVKIGSQNNKSFFWRGKPFKYQINISDREDKQTDPKRISVSYVYQPEPLADGRSAVTGPAYSGKALMAASDCKACHQISAIAVGPSFNQIAGRYKTQQGALQQLSKKIIEGGGGNWGKVHAMSAHPQISVDDAKEIVKYIFSLTDKKKPITKRPLAKSGSLSLESYPDEPRGRYVLTASYTDKGSKATGPLTSTDRIYLRDATLQTVYADAHPGFPRFRNSLSEGGNQAYILLKDIDLTGINKFVYSYASKDKDGEIEVRMDSQIGPVISRIAFPATGSFDKFMELDATLPKKISGSHHLYFVMIRRKLPDDGLIKLNTIRFDE